jgi:hypothetical protein
MLAGIGCISYTDRAVTRQIDSQKARALKTRIEISRMTRKIIDHRSIDQALAGRSLKR